jgi:hypothetical protein
LKVTWSSLTVASKLGQEFKKILLCGNAIDEPTEAAFNGETFKGFPADLLNVTPRKLRYMPQ